MNLLVMDASVNKPRDESQFISTDHTSSAQKNQRMGIFLHYKFDHIRELNLAASTPMGRWPIRAFKDC